MSETIRWRDWSSGAFAEAAAEDKPLLLSLVTAWSDECAGMDRSTYADPGVISLVDAHFIPVRVDADRRPDVNERYSLGGWPTTAFLTVDGEVLSGGTYISAGQMRPLLQKVAALWRAQSGAIRTRAAALRDAEGRPPGDSPSPPAPPDRSAIEHFRSLLIARYDRVNGGFDDSPKLPHAAALMFALWLSDSGSDLELMEIADVSLEKISALWDSSAGGFHRYGEASDWSEPGAEKTLEDNASLLHLYVEAALRRQSASCKARAADIVLWVKGTLANPDAGFYNAQSGATLDRSIYVDRNADMAAAFLRAAALFEDPWLRDFALKSLEAVILPGYAPGGGVAHSTSKEITGLLTDQIKVASALMWAHAITERLPYSMLAAELMQFAIRTMWDTESGSFRDRAHTAGECGLLREPIRPFDLNCEAACVLNRLATLTGDAAHRDRALAILGSLAPEYRRRGLFGAPYALAVREVIDHQPPAGLGLAQVDWHLG